MNTEKNNTETARFSRTERLIGAEALEKLKNSHVAVFGIGGVGGQVAEALARSGIGKIDLVDKDVVSESNINRQIVALDSTVGKYKSDVMADRIKDINPDCVVTSYKTFFLPETKDIFDFSKYDYVIDAIDTVTAKLELIMCASEAGVPVISCMGAGNKLCPTMLEVADIYKTSVCPLARIMRRELKKRGIKKLKVVYSKEEPIIPRPTNEPLAQGKNTIPASISFVPPAAGLILASEVVKDIIKNNT